MSRDHSLLEQSYRGVQEHLYALTAQFDCKKYFRLEVIPKSPRSETPWIEVFPDPRRDGLSFNERSFKVCIDVERKVWVWENLFSDGDSLSITPLPVSLSECVTVWLLGCLLEVHRTVISDQLDPFDILNTQNEFVRSPLDNDLRIRFNLWVVTARILIDAAKGDLDGMFPNTGSVVQEIAATQLPFNAEDFWGWVEKDFDKDFSSIGKTNVDFIKREFAALGFHQGYEVDVFQLATDFGETLAEDTISEVLKMRQTRQEQEKNLQMNKKVLGWVVPLTVGLIIAVGSALGY